MNAIDLSIEIGTPAELSDTIQDDFHVVVEVMGVEWEVEFLEWDYQERKVTIKVND